MVKSDRRLNSSERIHMPTVPRIARGAVPRDEGGDMTDLQRLTLRYVQHRLAQGQINKRTAEVLRCRLWDFATHTAAQPGNVNRRHVETWMSRADLSPAYRRSRLSTLRCFFKWCIVNGHMRRDPTIGVEAPRIPAYLPRALTAPEVGQLLTTLPDQRARLIILLMVQEGLRRKEVAEAQVGDVDTYARTLAVRGKGGQGRTTRVVPLSEQTWRALEDYTAAEGHRAGPLIRSKKWPDRGLTPHSLGELVSGWMADAGVKRAPGDGKSGHALRHSTAHHMMDRGASVREVQHALGHATIRSTEVYLRGRVEDLRSAMAGRSY